ncbi:type II toxin-antitoxin system death-on-curing family toxin [Patescibacteria group bacterium]|nr:type II toxin-antitoxin system death-on-curing family toxin [Patescibacteria group bacterium]
MIRYLSAESILVLHSELIDATGGSHGVRDAHLLASLAEKPRAVFTRKDLYQGIFIKAAVYLESVVNYHVFIDGNKRTGITACARFLFLNGYELTATNRAVVQFVLRVAIDTREIKTIAVWLKSHSRKI